MSVKGAIKSVWIQFFFAPVSPLPIAVFRILFALLVIAESRAAQPRLACMVWARWLGQHGDRTQARAGRTHQSVRADAGRRSMAGSAVLGISCIRAIPADGLYDSGKQHRRVHLSCLHPAAEPVIIHPGDTFMRVAGFFLMFAPAGAAFSLDRLIRIRRGREGPEIAPRSPWAQRMIQFELAFAYLTACWWKTMGSDWVDGTAVYYVWHLDQFRRFPIPAFLQSMIAVRIESWLTMSIEFALGVFVWFKELRYAVLLLGLLLHLSIEYSMNVPLFEWALLSAYVLFIDPDDLQRAMRWVRARFRMRAAAVPQSE